MPRSARASLDTLRSKSPEQVQPTKRSGIVEGRNQPGRINRGPAKLGARNQPERINRDPAKPGARNQPERINRDPAKPGARNTHGMAEVASGELALLIATPAIPTSPPEVKERATPVVLLGSSLGQAARSEGNARPTKVDTDRSPSEAQPRAPSKFTRSKRRCQAEARSKEDRPLTHTPHSPQQILS